MVSHDEIKKRIDRDLAKHTITQMHADGAAARLWVCSNDGSSIYKFTVCAPPGWLIVYGDMGECMWSRTYDMLEFVRSSIHSLDYFSSKASQDCIIKEESEEKVEEWFKTVKKEWRENGRTWGEKENEALKDIRSEYDNYGLISDFTKALYESELFRDSDDMPNIKEYTFQYLWKIEALKWFIKKLDAGEFVVKGADAQ